MLDEKLVRKSEELAVVSSMLKAKFVGIDNVIDQFIDAVRIWFLMPELMIRPVIVNLWGLTGSGKTDLVRTFVRLIKMSNAFVELQMDIDSYYTKIQDLIEFADIQSENPSILLLDEIQRFRTKDEDGKEVQRKSLQDVWMLLSDGKFQSASDKKRELLDILLGDLFNNNNVEIIDPNDVDDEDEVVAGSTTSPATDEKKKKKERIRKFKYKNSFWTARRLKKLLAYEGTVEEIMQWDEETKRLRISEALDSNATFEGTTYPKMLIIIAGNIDEAYNMSKDVSNADVDADVLHEFSKRISVVTIKGALLRKFKPEQVARFGNNHIIYESLNRDSYYKIIRKNVQDSIDRVYALHKIKIVPDESIFTTIYNNGVFPAQGVRPVISTISGIFENHIPTLLFEAIRHDVSVINVSYIGSELVGIVGETRVACKVELALDKIKEERRPDETAMVSAHEAGHTLVYALLFKVAPTQVKSITTNLDNDGFVGSHSVITNKNNLRDQIAVCLAGQAAEEVVFGEDFKSAGAFRDIVNATKLAAASIRSYGFDDFQSHIAIPSGADNGYSNTEFDGTNVIVETMLKEEKTRAISIIKANRALYSEITSILIEAGEISSEDVVALFGKYGIDIKVVKASIPLTSSYRAKWDDFAN